MARLPSGTRTPAVPRRARHWLAVGLGMAMGGLPGCGDASRGPESDAAAAPGAAALVQARIDATAAGPARLRLALALIDIQTAPPN